MRNWHWGKIKGSASRLDKVIVQHSSTPAIPRTPRYKKPLYAFIVLDWWLET